jgi:gamma-glutamyltranspeptidase / glutathione hydrolase
MDRRSLLSLSLVGGAAALLPPASPARAQAPAAAPEVKPGGHLRGDRYSGANFASRSAVIARSGMACTSHPLATNIALDILKAGGSAVDAAIAANAAIGVMEPTGNGIGGDLFAIVWDAKKGKLHGLNASGRAPLGQSLRELTAKVALLAAKRTDANRGDDFGVPEWGALSVTVPGCVDGWSELHGRFGKLKWADVLKPAINAARTGFPMTELIGYYLQRNMASLERLTTAGVVEEFANAKSVFLKKGATPTEGQIFTNPDLAHTLDLISQGGRDVFYKGVIADSMDRYFRRIGGPLRRRDFEQHESEWVEPVSSNYRGVDVVELPPNGQGTSALIMLNILEQFDLKSAGFGSADHLHLMTEAKKLAFEDRARFYADPAFYKKDVLKKLLSKEYAMERAKLIDVEKAATQVDHGDPRLVEGDTIYLTVADKDGMMISLIQSNFRGLGSGLVPDGPNGRTLGFMLQDRGAQFALEKDHPNAYAPGKRPFHTIIPAFALKDGRPFLSFGLMGGDMQPQGHAQIIVNMVDFGMNVQAAGDAARFHHDGASDATAGPRMRDGGMLELESGFSADTVAELQKRGHKISITSGPYGGYQAIQWDDANKVYWGASEFRKDGMAAGY